MRTSNRVRMIAQQLLECECGHPVEVHCDIGDVTPHGHEVQKTPACYWAGCVCMRGRKELLLEERE